MQQPATDATDPAQDAPATPAHAPKADWHAIRATWEAGGPGTTDRALAAAHGVSHTAVRKHREREGWKREAKPDPLTLPDQGEAEDGEEIAADAEVATGTVSTASNGETPSAVKSSPEQLRRDAVLERHRTEVKAVRAVLYDALNKHRGAKARQETVKRDALNSLRAARQASLALATLQKLERIAHGINDPADQAPGGGTGNGGSRKPAAVPGEPLTVIYETKPYDDEPDDADADRADGNRTADPVREERADA